MRLLPVLALLICCLGCLKVQEKRKPDQPANSVALPDTLSFDVKGYAEGMKAELGSLDTFEVAYDHVYPEGRRYLGKSLKMILVKMDKVVNLPKDEYRVYFYCADNYATSMLLSDFLKGDPWLAIKDLDATSGGFWDPIEEHGVPKDMSPAYLVWKGVKAEQDKDFVWPYALTSLILARE